MKITEQFVYGFLLAIILVSLLLVSQYGIHFNYLQDSGLPVLPSFGTALNWQTAICLALIFGLFFKNINANLESRVFFAFALLTFSWALIDVFWIIKARVLGNYLFGSPVLTILDMRGLIIGLVRNALMIGFALPFAPRCLCISRGVCISLLIAVLYWIALYLTFPYSGHIFSVIPFYVANVMPVIMAFKSWADVSWKKLLFA